MANSSLMAEYRQVMLALELIDLGMRIQVLESETDLSRPKLLRLYKERVGASPPKGQLPYSLDWFVTWRPNIHSSLFYAIYDWFRVETGIERLPALIRAYRLYLEQMTMSGDEPLLSATRAWILVRFFEADQFQLSACTECSGRFINFAHEPDQEYVCGICNPPSRAGKKATKAKQPSHASAVLSHARTTGSPDTSPSAEEPLPNRRVANL